MSLLSSIDSTLDGIFNALRHENRDEYDIDDPEDFDIDTCECDESEIDIPERLFPIAIIDHERRITRLEKLLHIA